MLRLGNLDFAGKTEIRQDFGRNIVNAHLCLYDCGTTAGHFANRRVRIQIACDFATVGRESEVNSLSHFQLLHIGFGNLDICCEIIRVYERADFVFCFKIVALIHIKSRNHAIECRHDFAVFDFSEQRNSLSLHEF